jgi:hypothetical protein
MCVVQPVERYCEELADPFKVALEVSDARVPLGLTFD